MVDWGDLVWYEKLRHTVGILGSIILIIMGICLLLYGLVVQNMGAVFCGSFQIISGIIGFVLCWFVLKMIEERLGDGLTKEEEEELLAK
jgi:uncharacterized membrane protein